MSLQQTTLSSANGHRLTINPYSDLNIFEMVITGRLSEVNPDDLWNHLQSVNYSIASLTAIVDKIEGHLMSIGYAPPSPGGG